MMRRIWTFLLATFLVATVIAGCANPAPTKTMAPETPAPTTLTKAPESKQTVYPITIKDAAGRDVTIPAEPKRVVSVVPSNTELMFAIGKNDVLVGRSDYCDYPEDAKKIASIGGMFPPTYEKIVSLKPDLILFSSGSEEVREKLVNDYKLNVFVVDPKSFDDLYGGIKTLGMVVNAQAGAEQVIADLQKQVKEITDKTAAATTKPKVFYELSAEPQIWTAGAGTFMNDLIKLAGGQNAVPEVKGWASITLEILAAANPDVIITPPGGAEKTKTRKGWESFKAIKETKVFALADVNHVERPGPRLVLGLKWMAETLHPELFTKK